MEVVAATAAHAVELVEGSAYRTGIGNCTGTRAWLENANHYPVEGICSVCSQVVRREEIGDEWEHTGRLAGQAPEDALRAAAATIGDMPEGDIDRALARVQDARARRKDPAGGTGPDVPPAGQEAAAAAEDHGSTRPGRNLS